MERNQLWYGDNLEVMRKMPDEIADLVYLDPPFNSNRNYNLLFKQHKGQDSPAQIMAFEDTWQWSPLEYEKFRADDRNAPLWKLVAALFDVLGPSEMMAYVVMMAPRLLELHRKLKPTGSLYLHCDPVASHYLKIVLDVIFGPDKFKNEITWKRTHAHGNASVNYGKISDTILFYTKGSTYVWNQPFLALDEEQRRKKYPHTDADGRRWQSVTLRNPGPRPNLHFPYTTRDGRTFQPHPNGWACNEARLHRYEAEGRLHYPSNPNGALRLKMYEDESPGEKVQNMWVDIPPIGSQAKERRGYPTQKPLALLERIIATSSNEGDVVMDPFAGCGTAIVAAERMNRKWIGIDVTYLAINEIIDRLNTEHAEGKPPVYELQGTPKDVAAAEALFETTKDQNHKPFEQWAVTLVGGRWREKKGADRGIDGRIGLWHPTGEFREALIQVKGGKGLTLSQVRDFANVIESNKAVLGILITMREPTKEMNLVADGMGFADWPSSRKFPRYQILTIEDLLEKGVVAQLPDVFRADLQQGVGKAKEAGQSGLDL